MNERRVLFGAHQLSSTVAACRLCGRPALEFSAAISLEPLSFCHECLHNAAAGVSVSVRERGASDRKSASLALRLLGEHEFGGAPMLEPQLDTLHIDPGSPIAAREIDRLLLLRFAIARRQYPWTHLLEEAGFNEDGLRSSRGTLIRARDGHRCLSLMEKTVCDFLHQNDIKHQREPHYPLDPELNAHGLRRADWLLDDGTLVEFWGLPNQTDYAAKMQEKRKLAVRHGLALVELVASDLRRLPEVFAPWMSASGAGPTAWSWSPVGTPEPPKARAAAPNGNEFNSALRQDRLERCQQAVKLQAEGLSRKAIGQELGVGMESVKELLRDGKFYATPESDRERLRIARIALEATGRGMTRADFRAEHGLSVQKAAEAWRDANITSDVDGGTSEVGRSTG